LNIPSSELIIYSRDSENLDTFLCTRDMTENLILMAVIFSNSALQKKNKHDSDMEITAWAQKDFQKSLSVSIYHPQMQIKALSCKEEATCEHYVENCKEETVLLSDKI